MLIWFWGFFISSSECAFVDTLLKLHAVLELIPAEFIRNILCKGKNFAQQSSTVEESLLDDYDLWREYFPFGVALHVSRKPSYFVPQIDTRYSSADDFYWLNEKS